MATPRKVMAVTAAVVAMLIAGCSSEGTPANQGSQGDTSGTGTPAVSAPPTVVSMSFNPDGLLSGNAKPSFKAGEPGKVSVVAQGKLSAESGGATLPIAFQNNTDAAVSHVNMTATASSGGKIIATGQSTGTDPSQLQPGEVGLTFVYFDTEAKISADVTYEFSAETSPADTSSFNTASLKVTQANLSGGKIVGSATNTTGAELQGPYEVDAYCFKSGALDAVYSGYADQNDNVAADGRVSFTNDLYGKSCSSYLVGVNAYFD